MQFTTEKFIEILKDPMCTSFEGEVEGCIVAFYREGHLGNRESHYTLKNGMCTAFLKGDKMPVQGYFGKDITKRKSKGTNIIPN